MSLSTVDEMTDIACQPKNFPVLVQSENPVPRGVVRTSIASLAGLDLVLDKFTAAEGVDDRAYVEQQLNSTRSQLTQALGAPSAKRMAGVLTAQTRFSNAMRLVGQQSLLGSGQKQQSDPQAVMTAGQQVWQSWLEDQQVYVDPRLGLDLVDPNKTPRIGSIPVGEFARAAAQTEQAPSAKDLPANQVCG